MLVNGKVSKDWYRQLLTGIVEALKSEHWSRICSAGCATIVTSLGLGLEDANKTTFLLLLQRELEGDVT